jgi:hypothetical protein
VDTGNASGRAESAAVMAVKPKPSPAKRGAASAYVRSEEIRKISERVRSSEIAEDEDLTSEVTIDEDANRVETAKDIVNGILDGTDPDANATGAEVPLRARVAMKVLEMDQRADKGDDGPRRAFGSVVIQDRLNEADWIAMCERLRAIGNRA